MIAPFSTVHCPRLGCCNERGCRFHPLSETPSNSGRKPSFFCAAVSTAALIHKTSRLRNTIWSDINSSLYRRSRRRRVPVPRLHQLHTRAVGIEEIELPAQIEAEARVLHILRAALDRYATRRLDVGHRERTVRRRAGASPRGIRIVAE